MTLSSAASPTPFRAPPDFAGLPYLGRAIDFAIDPVQLVRKGQQRYGDVFAFTLAGNRINVFLGPEAHDAYFRAPDEQLSQREVYQFMVPIFGKAIAYGAPPQLMDEQLGMLYPALREERLRRYVSLMQEETEKYFESYPAEKTVDLYKTMNEVTTYVASRCLVGTDFRRYLDAEFAQLYKELEGGINFISYFFNPYVPTPANRRRDRARTRLVEILSKVIEDRRRSGREEEDFLQTLMQAKYKDGRPLSHDEICGMLITIIFAGQHTSAVLAAWGGLELLAHPEHLPPILAEQRELFSDTSQITIDKLRRMDRLNAAFMEAERLHPPLIMLMRMVLKDFTFGGFTAKAGELAMVSPAMAHRLPRVFKDPDRYDPERFLAPREEHKQATYTLIGFGGGKHRCVGMHFAYLQVKAIWSVVLQKFQVELVDKNLRPNYASFVVGPQAPTRVRFRRKR